MAADTGPGKAELGNGSAYLGSLGTPAPEVLQSATLCFLRHGDCPRHRERCPQVLRSHGGEAVDLAPLAACARYKAQWTLVFRSRRCVNDILT